MLQLIAKKGNSGTVVNLRAAYEKFLLPVEKALWSTPLGQRGWGAPSWRTGNEPIPACLICGARDSNACLECNRCHARYNSSACWFADIVSTRPPSLYLYVNAALDIN